MSSGEVLSPTARQRHPRVSGFLARLASVALLLIPLAGAAHATMQDEAEPVLDEDGFPVLPDLRAVLRQAGSTAALASALSLVDDCSAPLAFADDWDGEFYTLTLSCLDHRGDKEVEVSYRILPRSGDFAMLEPVAIRRLPDAQP